MVRAMDNQRVVVILSGGIGNQLFQFAAGLSLSTRLNTELILDLSWYRHVRRVSRRRMELEQFIDFRNVKTIDSPIHPRLIWIGKMLRGQQIITDSQYRPNEFMNFSTKRDLSLLGHWQSEQYFSNVAKVIRTSINLNTFLSASSGEEERSISSSECIGLHVRRGDYVTNPKSNAFHGVCEKDYYLAGVEHIQQSSEVRKVFIFSDDPEWCTKNLKLDIETRFFDSSICDTDQLKLISLCNHHVISNSSFSWWAAWLGKKEGQRVVYPKGWFADGSDLENMPFGWIAI
jgi:hypothetical protein